MTSTSAQSVPAASDASAAGLLRTFREIARRHGFELDAAQERVVSRFERLYDDIAGIERHERAWLKRWRRRRHAAGIYLWGAVGRGKSFLMDEFFALAPIGNKERVHFHRFMQGIHRELRDLQGEPNPLDLISERFARQARLLCLDEFHVSDIGDAMLMRGLLQGLFKQGVVLVTTSNEHPDQLYAHGLQRAQFLPAIELLKTRLEVLELSGDSDYRLRALARAGVYHHPLGAAPEQALNEAFSGVAGEAGVADAQVEIDGRKLWARRLAPGTAWFDFTELCEGPRGTADYIELARRYHTVLVSGVPRFRADQGESLRRFTWLIDEFYDRQVKLIVSAEAAAERLYDAVTVGNDIERTRSRLIEMQTMQYLSLPHLA
jgi:cell division protein ZapE